MVACAPVVDPFQCPSRDELWRQLMSLLPRGRAWQTHEQIGDPADPDTLTVMQQFWLAYAEVLADLNARACDLVDQMFCDTVTELSTEWLADYGLPDDCSPWRSLCEKVNASGGSTADYLEAIALSVGWVVNVLECWPAPAVDCPNPKALLHFNGADASTAIADAVAPSRVWTAAGNAQLDTADKQFGTASLLLDGTGDWVSTPAHPELNLGSANFTIDAWFKTTKAGGTVEYLAGQSDSTPHLSSISFALFRNSSPANVMSATVITDAGSVTINGTTQFTNALNTGWHHIAVVRVGNILRLFIDGVQEGPDTAITGSVQASPNRLAVGALGEFTGTPWVGWIDEFRLSPGIARWNAAFTPPTAAAINAAPGTIYIDVDTLTSPAFLTPRDSSAAAGNARPGATFAAPCPQGTEQIVCLMLRFKQAHINALFAFDGVLA